MEIRPDLDACDWVRHVNDAWLVHAGLDESAERWIDFLEKSGDERLESACLMARNLCRIRGRGTDPKPWFYAGLFSLANAAEVDKFIAAHRVTRAAVPAMWDDEETSHWLANAGDETRKLVCRIRRSIEVAARDLGINLPC